MNSLTLSFIKSKSETPFPFISLLATTIVRSIRQPFTPGDGTMRRWLLRVRWTIARLDLPPLANIWFNVKETQMKMQMSRQSKRHFLSFFSLLLVSDSKQWITHSIVRQFEEGGGEARGWQEFSQFVCYWICFCFRISVATNNCRILSNKNKKG